MALLSPKQVFSAIIWETAPSLERQLEVAHYLIDNIDTINAKIIAAWQKGERVLNIDEKSFIKPKS